MRKLVSENDIASVGTYVLTYEVLLFPDLLVSFLDSVKPLINKTVEIVKDKRINIDSITRVGDSNYIEIEVTLLDNPVPVALIVAGVLGVLVIGGIYLSLDKVEKIFEVSPVAGFSLGTFLFIGSLIFGYTFLKKQGAF